MGIITSEEYQEFARSKGRHKYNATKKYVDGICFPSKLEASYYTKLLLLQKADAIKYFLRQVPIRLPGKTTFWCDFMIVENDNTIRWVDTKGAETQTFKLKRRMVEALYPIHIEIVRK